MLSSGMITAAAGILKVARPNVVTATREGAAIVPQFFGGFGSRVRGPFIILLLVGVKHAWMRFAMVFFL